jgi:diguanylate cyclase (GGDEF)-like protein
MILSPPGFEEQKTEVLQRYRILNGAEEYLATQIAQTAALTFGVPMVLASLNERYRHWYRAAYGVSSKGLEALEAFCAQANLSDTIFAVPDVRLEPHFARDPAVTGAPHVVFFAGAPLSDPDGKRFGSLYLIDQKPHSFDQDKLHLLQSFAGVVSQDICVRSAARYAVRDLIEAEHDKCYLFDMAMTDPLTKALNRRAFFRLAEREVLRASRHRKPLSTLIFDIDHFKRVNDTHGHAIGDEVLIQLASCVTGNIRDEDLLGRLGGEEFALVLPETDERGALVLANRLREAIRGLQFPGRAEAFSVSVSVGISGPEIVDIDILPALERADSALYRAKQNGRDRVEVATPLSGTRALPAA